MDPGEWRARLGLEAGKPVIVVGSTRGEEEERFVLVALQRMLPESASVVFAPRHLERAQAILASARERFGAASLRSEGGRGAFVVLDTYGELARVYGVADVAVIGGGFANFGGQNLLQPLAHGKPVLHGPHMQNFAEIAAAFLANGAAVQVRWERELEEAIISLLGDPVRRARLGAAARALVEANRGAKDKTLAVITALLPPEERQPSAVVRPFRVIH